MPNPTQTPEPKRIRTDVGKIFEKHRNSNDLIHVALNKTERDISTYTLDTVNTEVNKMLDELLDGRHDYDNKPGVKTSWVEVDAITAVRQRYQVKGKS